MRLQQVVQRLSEGYDVTFRPFGHSMEPLIKSGQKVTLAPHPDPLVELQVGDIVLAKVSGRLYLHKVTALEGERAQISNNKGHINGWTKLDHIYGRKIST